MTASTAIALPSPLQRQVEGLARGFFEGPGLPAFDFSLPKGEAALAAPDSVSWRVFKSPLALFIGGITAVLLELAEPKVRDGVWQHSTFRTDALPRLKRTGLAAMATVYGPRSRAEAMIARVVRTHGHVTGTTSEGEAYEANDPVLLDWVQATAAFGFLNAYHRYVRPLAPAERDLLYDEGAPAAALYGATGAPRSEAEMNALLERMRGRLVPSPIVAEFLAIMNRVPALPLAARPLQRLLVKAAVDILPDWARARLALGPRWSLRSWERPLVRAAARTSGRLLIRSSPAVQSCRRIGLPDDWLYRD